MAFGQCCFLATGREREAVSGLKPRVAGATEGIEIFVFMSFPRVSLTALDSHSDEQETWGTGFPSHSRRWPAWRQVGA